MVGLDGVLSSTLQKRVQLLLTTTAQQPQKDWLLHTAQEAARQHAQSLVARIHSTQNSIWQLLLMTALA